MAKLASKILIARTDRLGDVLLSLPVLPYLRHYLPEAELHFLCKPEYAEVVSPYLASLHVKTILTEFEDPSALREALQSDRYAAALFLFADRRLAYAAWRAGIHRRFGPYSKPWSFFLFNHGVRQKRAQCLKTEAEYNLDLAQKLLKNLWGKSFDYRKHLAPITLPVNEAAKRKADQFLAEKGLKENEFFVIHPGMGGSALNLSGEDYAKWIPQIIEKLQIPALVSIGPGERDQELGAEILRAHPQLSHLRNCRLPHLMEVFRQARLVVAPSTGPLHLAHYVGTHTWGLYSPLGTQRRERWQPWGGSGKVQVIVGQLEDPGTSHQTGSMALGAWQSVLSI